MQDARGINPFIPVGKRARLDADAAWRLPCSSYEPGCCKRAMRASAAAAICSRRFIASASAFVSRLPLLSSLLLQCMPALAHLVHKAGSKVLLRTCAAPLKWSALACTSLPALSKCREGLASVFSLAPKWSTRFWIDKSPHRTQQRRANPHVRFHHGLC